MPYFDLNKKEKWLSNFVLIFVLASLIIYSVFFQFIYPTFYQEDDYYHIAVSRFIKEFGPNYDFRWAQFSTFKEFFSDKDFLFHLFTIPFLFFSKNIILAGKYAIIFYNILFIIIYALILRKYLPAFLTACFLLLPFLSSSFLFSFGALRPATLANILTILGMYFAINRKWLFLFLISLLFPLAHISFFTILIFVLFCEAMRYVKDKTFFPRNIYAVFLGTVLGCLIHPNNPNNWLSFHLNAILVPFYSISRVGINFGVELYSGFTKFILFNNFALFLTLYIILWVVFISKMQLSLSTWVWWGCSSFYLALSFLGVRYWYTAEVLFFIFAASFIKDWMEGKTKRSVILKTRIFISIYSIIIIFFFPLNVSTLKDSLVVYSIHNTHYENVGKWMNKNIPEGETIYHVNWSDSPYFICLNPKNNYIVVLDPIYMFYRYPRAYLLYFDLSRGADAKPYKTLKEFFKVNYGYTDKGNYLYSQIKKDAKHFKILYDDELGIVFKIIN